MFAQVAGQTYEERRSRSLHVLITEQLRVVLEDRVVRIGVVGMLLIFSSAFAMVPMPQGIDAAWMFIVPVAISSVAAGLVEGLLVALAASFLYAVYVAVGGGGSVDAPQMLGIMTARFALYGLTSGVLGLFAEAHRSVESNLRTLAAQDPLTKVANVSSFYEEMGLLEEIDDPSFAVVVLDIDDLKRLNDEYGHQVGSGAIQMLAATLKSIVRASDCVARFGGDEFVLILKDADRAGAQIVINRVREMLTKETLQGAPGESVSVSAGVAMFGQDGATSEQVLAAADAAMYEDKRSRKARAVVRA